MEQLYLDFSYVYMNHALTYCNCNIEIVSFMVNVDACLFGGKGHDNYLL